MSGTSSRRPFSSLARTASTVNATGLLPKPITGEENDLTMWHRDVPYLFSLEECQMMATTAGRSFIMCFSGGIHPVRLDTVVPDIAMVRTSPVLGCSD